MSVNKHGLTRTIPADVQREIRQRCGFGCVFDGEMVWQYEHFDPEFAECREHCATGITLLCGSCHDERTKGLISIEQVRAADADPYARRAGFAQFVPKLSTDSLEVQIGNLRATDTNVVIHVLGLDLLRIDPPEALGGPYRISGRFFDVEGAQTLSIRENEVRALVANWDVQQVANRIEVRRGPGDFALVLRFDPPAGIVIERIAMVYKDFAFVHSPSGPSVIEHLGVRAEIQELTFHGARAAVVAGLDSLVFGLEAEYVGFTGTV